MFVGRAKGKDSTIIRIMGGRREQGAERLTVQAYNQWWKKWFLFNLYFLCVSKFTTKHIKAGNKVEFIQSRVEESVNQT